MSQPKPESTTRDYCREIYEVWAGSEGIPIPITCTEGYLLQLVKQMRDIAKDGMQYTAPVHASDISQERVDETAKSEHVYFQFAPVHEPVTMAHHEIKGGPDDTKWRTYPKVQPEHEPVAWVLYYNNEQGTPMREIFYGKAYMEETKSYNETHRGLKCQVVPLYTAPPKREWVGLTDDEYKTIRYGSDEDGNPHVDHELFDEGEYGFEINIYVDSFASAIEAKLKEKNT